LTMRECSYTRVSVTNNTWVKKRYTFSRIDRWLRKMFRFWSSLLSTETLGISSWLVLPSVSVSEPVEFRCFLLRVLDLLNLTM
jgi:hypothetical protein